MLFSMAKKKRRTVPRPVPEDPDSDIEDRDEALQPDLTEAQQNRKVSGEARAARDRDNTYHGRKCKIPHLIDHLPQELWDGRPAMPKPGRPGQEWVYLPDKALLRKWRRKWRR
ncbi:hypothetical protein QJQ45_012771 [Haematococcus lacustris]|nr:hypothetical protein QJQ45_012771 [Haematococcus lacustris]